MEVIEDLPPVFRDCMQNHTPIRLITGSRNPASALEFHQHPRSIWVSEEEPFGDLRMPETGGPTPTQHPEDGVAGRVESMLLEKVSNWFSDIPGGHGERKDDSLTRMWGVPEPSTLFEDLHCVPWQNLLSQLFKEYAPLSRPAIPMTSEHEKSPPTGAPHDVGDAVTLVINPLIYAEVSIRFRAIEDLNAAVPASMFRRDAHAASSG